jgi:DNA ligase (NAD+)
LEKSKSVPFERVLFALGIRNVGEVVAKTIVAEYHDIDSIIRASVEDLSAINTVGEVIALSVKAFFENPVNLDIVHDCGLLVYSSPRPRHPNLTKSKCWRASRLW